MAHEAVDYFLGHIFCRDSVSPFRNGTAQSFDTVGAILFNPGDGARPACTTLTRFFFNRHGECPRCFMFRIHNPSTVNSAFELTFLLKPWRLDVPSLYPTDPSPLSAVCQFPA